MIFSVPRRVQHEQVTSRREKRRISVSPSIDYIYKTKNPDCSRTFHPFYYQQCWFDHKHWMFAYSSYYWQHACTAVMAVISLQSTAPRPSYRLWTFAYLSEHLESLYFKLKVIHSLGPPTLHNSNRDCMHQHWVLVLSFFRWRCWR